jgi:hypothetical protein
LERAGVGLMVGGTVALVAGGLTYIFNRETPSAGSRAAASSLSVALVPGVSPGLQIAGRF